MANSPTLAYYGNVAIQRAFCPECKGYAFIIDKHFACCGERAESIPAKIKRMSDVPLGRSIPSRKRQLAIMNEQDYRCLYCRRGFGAYVYSEGKPIKLRLHWDHMLPYVYSLCNRPDNFAAACHICNGMKHANVYNTIEEAQVDLKAKWEAKGFTD